MTQNAFLILVGLSIIGICVVLRLVTSGPPGVRCILPPSPTNTVSSTHKLGVKFDSGKLPMELIPPEAITAMARRLQIGAKKHEARNWEKGLLATQVQGALMRHLNDWAAGIDDDSDPLADGSSNLEGVLINAAFLVAFEKRGWLGGTLDNRPRIAPVELKKPIQGEKK